jgi:hypothetical protein
MQKRDPMRERALAEAARQRASSPARPKVSAKAKEAARTAAQAQTGPKPKPLVR